MGDFRFTKTEIEGLVLIDPKYVQDERGYFLKFFERRLFQQHGLPTTFGEENESCSKKGTLRGIHFQTEYPQGKLVRVSHGAVYDVAVDLRPESSTFGKWAGFELSAENKTMLYLPERFGHGFLALADETVFCYMCTDIYSPRHDDGIIWDDPDIGIQWPTERITELIISEKDRQHQSFADYAIRFKKEA